MQKQQFMELNKETAMRLWAKTYGRETKVKDFTGRTMAKGAYNDRNSEFGWNVDHILPQSRGGKTADHNLVCCHILTNDEKADRFPCFTANGVPFEIRKVQNHYEIHEKKKHINAEQEQDDVDFYDSAAGVRFFKSLKGIQNKKRFVGTVFIYLKAVSNGAVIDFIESIFDSENISYSQYNNWYNYSPSHTNTYPLNVKIAIRDFDLETKSDTSELLDKCVLLNTYLSSYFFKCKYIEEFDIYYRIDCIERTTIPKEPDSQGLDHIHYAQHLNGLHVSDLVLDNTDAGGKVQKNPFSNSGYTLYNFVFANLEKNLLKEANGK